MKRTEKHCRDATLFIGRRSGEKFVDFSYTSGTHGSKHIAKTL
jgi:hypothetical protein